MKVDRLIAGVAALSLYAFGACPPKGYDSLKHREPDIVKQSDGWVYKEWVTAKGTRSEGHTAMLFHNGKAVCPDGKDTILDTPFGAYVYKEGHRRWGWHGWQPLAPKRLLIGS